jgi:taurine dioxygenase
MGDPEVIIVEAHENSARIAGETWHSDISCDVEPPMVSILHLTEATALGADTLPICMRLTKRCCDLCSELTALHDGARKYEGRATALGRRPEYPRAEHPVVRTHPVTGRSLLFVNRMFTTRILQLKRTGSDAPLEMLIGRSRIQSFKCRFRWQPNSVAFWNNRCVQHQALWTTTLIAATATRVTIAGNALLLSR